MNKKAILAITLGLLPGMALAILAAYYTRKNSDEEKKPAFTIAETTTTRAQTSSIPEDAIEAMPADLDALRSNKFISPANCSQLHLHLANAAVHLALENRYPEHQARAPTTTFYPPRPVPPQARPTARGHALDVEGDDILALYHGALLSLHSSGDKLHMRKMTPLHLPRHFSEEPDAWQLARLGDTLVLARQGDFLQSNPNAARRVFFPRARTQTQIAIFDVSNPDNPKLQKLFRSGALVELIKTPTAIHLLTRDHYLLPKALGELLSSDRLGDPDSGDRRPAPNGERVQQARDEVIKALRKYEQDHPERPIFPPLAADNPHYLAKNARDYRPPELPDPCSNVLIPTDRRALHHAEFVDHFSISPDGSLTLQRLMTPMLRYHNTPEGLFLSYQARGLETAEIGWREQDASFFWKIDQPDQLQLIEGELLGLARTPKHLLALHTVLPRHNEHNDYFLPERTQLTLDPFSTASTSIPAEPGWLQQQEQAHFVIHHFPDDQPGVQMGHITVRGELSELISNDRRGARWHPLPGDNVLQTRHSPHKRAFLYSTHTGKQRHSSPLHLDKAASTNLAPLYLPQHKLLALPTSKGKSYDDYLQMFVLEGDSARASKPFSHETLHAPFPSSFKGIWKLRTRLLDLAPQRDRFLLLSNLGLSLHAANNPEPPLDTISLFNKILLPRMTAISLGMRTYAESNQIYHSSHSRGSSAPFTATDAELERLMRPVFMGHGAEVLRLRRDKKYEWPRRIYDLAPFEGIASTPPETLQRTFGRRRQRKRLPEKFCCWRHDPNGPLTRNQSPYDWKNSQVLHIP